MTDKIKKFLAKLSPKELRMVRELTTRILADDLKGLNVVQLKGSANVFRVKKGRLRIIFQTNRDAKNNILTIDRRNEKTYKNY